MPSNRIGIQAGSVSITGTTNINQSQTTTTNYNTTKADTVVGFFPETFPSEVPIKNREGVSPTLDNLKVLISNGEDKSDRQPLIVIHGPVNTGKSTAAHFLMADETLKFENRIRINAQTKKSMENDFRELHKVMRVLQNQPRNDQEDMKLLLKWLYRNLLSNRTLLIFDNVAVLDLDLHGSAFKDVYELVPYLPLRTSLIAGKVAPTIVITTRAVMSTESALFSAILVNPPAKIVHSSLPSLKEKIECDLDLFLKVENGNLAAFLLVVISFVLPDSGVVNLLIHLCCHCTQIQDLLKLKNEITKDHVIFALQILKNFSLVDQFENTVRPPFSVELCVKNGFTAPTVFNEKDLMETIISSVSAVVRVPEITDDILEDENEPVQRWWSSVENCDKIYDTNLEVLELWKKNFNALISRLYSFMLKYQVPTSKAFYTFGFQGNCNELKSEHVLHVLQMTEFQVCPPGLFAKLKADLCDEWEVTLAITQGYPGGPILKSSSGFHINFSAVEVSETLLGNPPGGSELMSSRLTGILLSLHRMEYLWKVGKLSHMRALEKFVATDKKSFNFCYRFTYLLSALPPSSIQASILTSQGKYVEARQFLKIELKRSRAEVGLHNYTTAALEHSLAKIEAYNGNFSEALKLIGHVIEVLRQLLGVTAIRYIKAVATNAKILALRGDYQEAYLCLSDAISTFHARIHKDHPHCLILRYYQAKNLLIQERYSEALTQAEAVLSAMKSQFVSKNRYRLKCSLVRACALGATGDLRNSRKLLEQQKEIVLRIYEGAKNPRTLKFDLLHAKSLVSIDDKRATDVAGFVLDKTNKCSLKLRMNAMDILCKTKRRETNDQFVGRLRDLVNEISESAGLFHNLTLKCKLLLAETLLHHPAKHFSEVKKLVRAAMNVIHSDEYAAKNLLFLKWRQVDMLLMIHQKKYNEAKVHLRVLQIHAPLDSPMKARVLYTGAIMDAAEGGYREAYTKMSDLFHLRITSKMNFTSPDVSEMNAFLAFLLLKIKGSSASEEAVNFCQNSIVALGSIYCDDHQKYVQAKLNLAIAYTVAGNKVRADALLEDIKTSSNIEGYIVNNLKHLKALGNSSDVISQLEYRRGGEICFRK